MFNGAKTGDPPEVGTGVTVGGFVGVEVGVCVGKDVAVDVGADGTSAICTTVELALGVTFDDESSARVSNPCNVGVTITGNVAVPETGKFVYNNAPPAHIKASKPNAPTSHGIN